MHDLDNRKASLLASIFILTSLELSHGAHARYLDLIHLGSDVVCYWLEDLWRSTKALRRWLAGYDIHFGWVAAFTDLRRLQAGRSYLLCKWLRGCISIFSQTCFGRDHWYLLLHRYPFLHFCRLLHLFWAIRVVLLMQDGVELLAEVLLVSLFFDSRLMYIRRKVFWRVHFIHRNYTWNEWLNRIAEKSTVHFQNAWIFHFSISIQTKIEFGPVF